MIISINEGDVGISNISTLVLKLNFIFKLEKKQIPNYSFFVDLNDIDPVSALIIYKALEYSILKGCLLNPQANLKEILPLVSKYGIEKLFKQIIDKSQVEKIYRNLKPTLREDFFIAPHAINRFNYKSKNDLEKVYTTYIEQYYKDICPSFIPYIKTCICEIASNFLSHAVEDDNSILMALGDKNKIEVVCVDNSKGIVNSLNPNSKNHKKTISSAFERGVSSKMNQGHCGTGLWLIKLITKYLNGIFRIHTEDMSYICKGGKVFVRNTTYWKGSIVYLKLNVVPCSNIDEFLKSLMNNNLGLINNE